MERLIHNSDLVFDSSSNMVQVLLKDISPEELHKMGLQSCQNLFKGSVSLSDTCPTELGSLICSNGLEKESTRDPTSEIFYPEGLKPSHPVYYSMLPVRKLKPFAVIASEAIQKSENQKLAAVQNSKSKKRPPNPSSQAENSHPSQKMHFIFEELSTKLDEMLVEKRFKHGEIKGKRIISILSELVQKAFRKNVSFSHETFQNQDTYGVVLLVHTEKLVKGITNNIGVQTCKSLLATHLLQKIAPKIYKQWFLINSKENVSNPDIKTIQEYCIGKSDQMIKTFCPENESIESSAVNKRIEKAREYQRIEEEVRRQPGENLLGELGLILDKGEMEEEIYLDQKTGEKKGERSENESLTGQTTCIDSRGVDNQNESEDTFSEDVLRGKKGLGEAEAEKQFDFNFSPDSDSVVLEGRSALKQRLDTSYFCANFDEEEAKVSMDIEDLNFFDQLIQEGPDPLFNFPPDFENYPSPTKPKVFQVELTIEKPKEQGAIAIEKGLMMKKAKPDECEEMSNRLSRSHPKQDLVVLRKRIQDEPYCNVTLAEIYEKAGTCFEMETLKSFVFRLANYLTLLDNKADPKAPSIKILVFGYVKWGSACGVYKLVKDGRDLMSGERNFFDQPRLESFKIVCEMLLKVLNGDVKAENILQDIILDNYSAVILNSNLERKETEPNGDDDEKIESILLSLKKKKPKKIAMPNLNDACAAYESQETWIPPSPIEKVKSVHFMPNSILEDRKMSEKVVGIQKSKENARAPEPIQIKAKEDSNYLGKRDSSSLVPQPVDTLKLNYITGKQVLEDYGSKSYQFAKENSKLPSKYGGSSKRVYHDHHKQKGEKFYRTSKSSQSHKDKYRNRKSELLEDSNKMKDHRESKPFEAKDKPNQIKKDKGNSNAADYASTKRFNPNKHPEEIYTMVRQEEKGDREEGELPIGRPWDIKTDKNPRKREIEVPKEKEKTNSLIDSSKKQEKKPGSLHQNLLSVPIQSKSQCLDTRNSAIAQPNNLLLHLKPLLATPPPPPPPTVPQVSQDVGYLLQSLVAQIQAQANQNALNQLVSVLSNMQNTINPTQLNPFNFTSSRFPASQEASFFVSNSQNPQSKAPEIENPKETPKIKKPHQPPEKTREKGPVINPFYPEDKNSFVNVPKNCFSMKQASNFLDKRLKGDLERFKNKDNFTFSKNACRIPRKIKDDKKEKEIEADVINIELDD